MFVVYRGGALKCKRLSRHARPFDEGLSMALTQATVKLTTEMRDFLANEAAREQRTVSSQIRHLVALAMRRAEKPAMDGEPRR